MKTTLLQFELLSDLAGFSKLVNDRGYVIIIKDLTLQCKLTETEWQWAVKEFNAKLLPINRAAA